ncbi:MAG: hypothetical protein Q8M31_02545 [Beijerinckiaceae bacterium]|nr:hypothetical protein [Beijerinckiaceae bacterium]
MAAQKFNRAPWLLREIMLLIDNAQTRPSKVTGLSLVLFLFLSLLSMMAAFEVSKPVDELRNNVVASLHEYSAQTADPEASDLALLVEAHRERLPPFKFTYQNIIVSSFSVPASKSFHARGPPMQRFAAS